MAEPQVRAAFAQQAEWCRRLGSPLTAALCDAIGRNIDGATALGRRVLGWAANPDGLHDSVPLRLCGGLHALARSGRVPDLAALYPPHPPPDPEVLRAVLRAAFEEAGPDLLPWLDRPPQTNEVGRSGVFAPGLAVVAAATGLPLALHELGASAGLNLLIDRYRCEAGSRVYGDPGSAVRLAPAWEGADPPALAVEIVRRRGVDTSPLDVTDPAERARLLAYVWPDQTERLARLEAALAIALGDPPPVARGDAADWLEAGLAPEPGIARVVLHSIAFQYFPPDTQARVTARMMAAGGAATADSPLAWLSYEIEPGAGSAVLRLRLWPGGSDRVLAHADPHGRRVTWEG